MDIVKKGIPIKIITTHKFSSQWMTEEIRRLKRKKLYKHRRAIETGKQKDWRKFHDSRAKL